MRSWMSGLCLIGLAVGCNHPCHRGSDRWAPCDSPPESCRPSPSSPAPAPAPAHPPAEARVTMPPPKVVIEVPETTVVRAPECAGPQCAAGQPHTCGATYAGQQQSVMVQQAMTAQPQAVMTAQAFGVAPGVPVMNAAVQSAGGFAPAGSIASQTVTPPRTRLGLTLDTVRIPFPILRFIPVTRPGEVTTTTQVAAAPQTVFTQAAVQSVQAAPQFVSQAVVAQPQMVVQQAPTVQPQFVAQPQFLMQPQQAQPQFVVPPQMVMPQPQMVAVPQAAPQAAAQAVECPPVSRQTLDALQQELDRARGAVNGPPRR